KLPLGALANLSKEPEGDPENPRFDQIDALPVGDTLYPVRLARVRVGPGEQVWVFSEATVRAIDPLYEEYGPLVGEVLPPVFFERPVLGMELWQWLGLLGTLVGAGLLSLLIERLTLAALGRVAKWTGVTWDDALVSAGKGPLRLLSFALLGAL